MILADTSAWIEYDRATGSNVETRLTALITDDGPLAVTEPVIMELVAGARNDARERALRRLLLRFRFLPFEPASDFDTAARIYRTSRRAGITPRGMLDGMIAAVAWRTGASLLACDSDMARIAKIVDIELDRASVSA